MTAPESNDRDGPVRPPVIDIEAEDVTPASGSDADKPVAPDEAVPPPPPQRKPHHWRRWGILLLAILAAAAGAWAYKDYGQRFWPSDQMTTLANRVGTLEATDKTLNDQLTSLGGSIDALKGGEAAQAEQLATADRRGQQAEADIAQLKDTLAAHEARFAEAETALGDVRAAVDALKQSIATAGDNVTVTAPDPAALAAVTQRVEALEREFASLKAEVAKEGEGAESTALLSQTLADLKAKFATGAPYLDELNRIARLVPAAPGVERLSAHAATGLPDSQVLAGELAKLMPDIPAPAPEADAKTGNEYWDYLVDLFGSVVTIRTVGETNWRDVAERARAYAETDDLPAAISLIERAEGEPPAALAAWRNKAQARLTGEAALEELSAAVLRVLAAQGTAP